MGRNRFASGQGGLSRGLGRQRPFEDVVRHPERSSARIRFRTALKAPREFRYDTELLRAGGLEVWLNRGDPDAFKALVAARFPDMSFDGMPILVRA